MTESPHVDSAARGPARSLIIHWSGALMLSLGVVVLGLGLAHRLAEWPTPAHPVAHQSPPSEPAPEHSLGTPAAKLPELQAPLTHHLRIVADRELPQHERLKPLVDGSTIVISDPADILALRYILRDPEEGDTLRNECANALRVNDSPDLADDLRAVLADHRNGERFRSFAAQHLGVLFAAAPADMALRDSLRAALDDHALAVRREALWPLCQQGDALALARAEAWLRDPAQHAIHDLCCRIAAQAGRRDWLEPLRALVASSDVLVSTAARRAVAALEEGS